MKKQLLFGMTSMALIFSIGLTTVQAATITVKKGDTLYSIANKYNISVTELQKVNSLKNNVIYVGQTLKTSTTSTSKTTYTVKKGDTLWSISRSYKVTVDDIKKWNNLKSNTLTIGQKLTMTATSTVAPDSPAKESGSSNTGSGSNAVYKVKAGDTLWSIAQRYGVSVDQIKKMNGLSSNVITIGQNLSVVETVLFIRPSEGRVSDTFGNRTNPITGVKERHNGVDFAQSGTVPIVAVADGTVSQSYRSTSYGEVVFVVHNLNGKTYETVYAHMRDGSRTVAPGSKVKKGQRLGYMGATGYATGQHLHFELHEGRWNIDKSNAVNPLNYLP